MCVAQERALPGLQNAVHSPALSVKLQAVEISLLFAPLSHRPFSQIQVILSQVYDSKQRYAVLIYFSESIQKGLKLLRGQCYGSFYLFAVSAVCGRSGACGYWAFSWPQFSPPFR